MAPRFSLPLGVPILWFLPVSDAGFSDFLLVNRIGQKGWAASSKSRLLKATAFVLSFLLDQYRRGGRGGRGGGRCHVGEAHITGTTTPCAYVWKMSSEYSPHMTMAVASTSMATYLMTDLTWVVPRSPVHPGPLNLKLLNLGVTSNNHTIVSLKVEKPTFSGGLILSSWVLSMNLLRKSIFLRFYLGNAHSCPRPGPDLTPPLSPSCALHLHGQLDVSCSARYRVKKAGLPVESPPRRMEQLSSRLHSLAAKRSTDMCK